MVRARGRQVVRRDYEVDGNNKWVSKRVRTLLDPPPKKPEEIDDEKARRGYAFIYGNADDWDVIRDSV